jgi:hypothetical protein
MKPEEIIVRYGRSEHGNFGAIDQIGVPHAYTIGPRHVEHAAKRFSGVLGTACIEDGEKSGIRCYHPKCRLTLAEHEQALLVECLVPPPDHKTEIEAYLKSVLPWCEEDKFVGFTFLRKW